MPIWEQYLIVAVIALITAPVTTWIALLCKHKFYNRKLKIVHMTSTKKFGKTLDDALQNILTEMDEGKFEFKDRFNGKRVIVNTKNIEYDFISWSETESNYLILFSKETFTNYLVVYFVERKEAKKLKWLNRII